MFGQPVFEKRVGDADADRARVGGDKRGRLEPGVETVPVYLGFNSSQDLFPEIHVIPKAGARHTFARATSRVFATVQSEMPGDCQFVGIFHSFFHRCGKLW